MCSLLLFHVPFFVDNQSGSVRQWKLCTVYDHVTTLWAQQVEMIANEYKYVELSVHSWLDKI